MIRSEDDTKLGGIIANALEDRNKIQKDLERLEHSDENNRIKFNRDKTKLHTWGGIQTHNYRMGDTSLSNTMRKKDFGILVDHKLNMSQQ